MNEKNIRLVTAESVRAGRPDKFCDQVADAILDAHLRQDLNARVAVEVFATAGKMIIGGEVTSKAEVDCGRIVADAIDRIGYTMCDLCEDSHDPLELEIRIHDQSPDISAAVGAANLGAGDQGIVVGYATNETDEYLPLPVVLAHRICKRLDELKPENPWMGADGKAQVTVAYENDVPVAVTAVVVSLQHDAEIDHKSICRFIGKEVLGKVLPRELLKEDARILINPSGKFVLGGPAADAGLTGRKLAVDQYGPVAHIGGGALSGKDPTKADRSGAYAARGVAKNIVAAGMAKRCEVQIAYAIGRSEPVSIIPSTKRMVYQPTGSIYQVLSSEVATKHGLNVSACIFDELHTQPTRALYDVMTQGSGDARKQPLWFFLTTAGTDRNSVCWEVHQKALDILEGRKHDPRFYPVVYGLPDDADWQDEQNWYKCNPSLGYTITIDKVRDAYRKALETPADENMFRQLRLNQWVKQSIRWMPMDKWDECGGNIDPYELEGRACYAGLDLSSTSDLTTLVLVFPPRDENEAYMVLPFFWLPEDTLALRVRRDHVMYDQWERQGFIQTTEGNVVHYGFIEKFICDLGESYNIREIAYDRWNATMMVQALEDDGFTMIPFGQGFRDMSPPTKELMRIVLEHRLNHGGHPILRWNFDNAYVRTDPAGNLKLDKEKSTEKIDGAVALVMALDRAMKNQNGSDSVYDDRGLLLL